MRKIKPKALLTVLVIDGLLLVGGWIGGAAALRAQAAASLAVPALQSTGVPEGSGPWVVRAYFSDPTLVNRLAARLEPWEVHRDQGYLVAEVTLADYQWMQSIGFRLEVDQRRTQELQAPRTRLPGQVNGIPGFPCYRTVEETYATAASLAQTYPHLASWIDIGDSWEKTVSSGLPGYDLRVLRLTNDAIQTPKPGLFIMSSVHAREYAPAELNTRFAEYLLSRYNVDADVTWLLDYNVIHLLLQANPDGRKLAESGASWRKNTDGQYCIFSSLRGIDLNRNFPFEWDCCGGSSSFSCDETFHGPLPASEPETQAMRDYLRANFPDQRSDPITATVDTYSPGIFLDLHSYSQLVLWPWGGFTQMPPNGNALQTLGRKLAYFNNYTPEQAINLYPTDGTSDDFAYGDLGLAAFTFEMGTDFFQDCSTFENTIVPANMPALLYAAKSARLPYRTPSGPDMLNLSSSPGGQVFPGSLITLTATVDDRRYNNSHGVEPVQNISNADYSIDAPPWMTPTLSGSLSASDGSFDSPVEDAYAVLDTSGLSAGRHIVYMSGWDVNENGGPVSATFIDIMVPQKVYLSVVVR